MAVKESVKAAKEVVRMDAKLHVEEDVVKAVKGGVSKCARMIV